MPDEKEALLGIEELDLILSRLEKRRVLFEPSPDRLNRSYGHDSPFTENDLVAVYDYQDKRIYYIVGRGRAERIIDSLLSNGHNLMKFTKNVYGKTETRHFKVIEDRIGSKANTAITWQPTKTFDNVSLIGSLKMAKQEDGSYKIEREMSSAHPCKHCTAPPQESSLKQCPQLEGNIISIEQCTIISEAHYRKAWRWIAGLLSKIVSDIEKLEGIAQ